MRVGPVLLSLHHKQYNFSHAAPKSVDVTLYLWDTDLLSVSFVLGPYLSPFPSSSIGFFSFPYEIIFCYCINLFISEASNSQNEQSQKDISLNTLHTHTNTHNVLLIY